MKLKYIPVYHDEARRLLCTYERNVIYDKIFIMDMNEQIGLLCTWLIAQGLSALF